MTRPGHRHHGRGGKLHPHLDRFDLIVPPPMPPIRVTRQGIARVGSRRPHPRKPLTETHLAVLAQVGAEPRRAAAIAQTLGLKAHNVQSALYVLAAREEVIRVVGKGWIRFGP